MKRVDDLVISILFLPLYNALKRALSPGSFQRSEMHEACPKHPGDWYFSGDYPTPGGVKLLNKAFIDYIEQVYQF